MIIYASATNIPIKDMFMSGVIPGILMGIGFMIYSYRYAKKLKMKPKPKASLREVWDAFKGAFFALLTPVIILWGIASGVFTATESGAVAVLYCILYGFIRKKITVKDLIDSLYQAAISTLGPMIVICFASAFSYLLSYCNFADNAVGAIMAISSNKYIVMLLIIALIMII